MLILTRRSNERIHIGDDVVLVVLSIENNRVKLGIDAPSEVAILREEIVGDSRSKKSDSKKESNDEFVGTLNAKTG